MDCQTVNQLDWQAFHPIFTSCPIWATTQPILSHHWHIDMQYAFIHFTKIIKVYVIDCRLPIRRQVLKKKHPYISLLSDSFIMKHLVSENLVLCAINLWFWSQLQDGASNLHSKSLPLLKMILSSPCGPSCVWECVSGGDYTADRVHSDAT